MKTKKPVPQVEPSLKIGMAANFSKVVLIHTDEKGNKTETIIARDGGVRVNTLTAEDLYASRNEFFAGTMLAQDTIKSVDVILAEQKLRVTRHLFTTPHLKQ